MPETCAQTAPRSLARRPGQMPLNHVFSTSSGLYGNIDKWTNSHLPSHDISTNLHSSSHNVRITILILSFPIQSPRHPNSAPPPNPHTGIIMTARPPPQDPLCVPATPQALNFLKLPYPQHQPSTAQNKPVTSWRPRHTSVTALTALAVIPRSLLFLPSRAAARSKLPDVSCGFFCFGRERGGEVLLEEERVV